MKTPAQKTKAKVLKLCQEKKAVKMSDGKKAFSANWYSSAKNLAMNNPRAATYIAGSLKNASTRGVVGVVGLVTGELSFIHIENAIKEIQALGEGKLFVHPKERK